MAEQFQRDFFVWPNRLLHLPYCNLRRAHRHRFGALSLWLKIKCLSPRPGSWQQLKFRPLVSYKQHHWRRLLILACRSMNFIQKRVAPGFAVSSLAELRCKIFDFNKGPILETPPGTLHEPLGLATDDIDSFFTLVPRREVLAEVQWACKQFIRATGHEYL